MQLFDSFAGGHSLIVSLTREPRRGTSRFFIACAVVYLTVHVTHAAHRLIPVPSQRWHRTWVLQERASLARGPREAKA
jgi:hypothetical protein